MANIKESRLTSKVNNHWIHLTAITNVEFEQEELGGKWLFCFILKKSDADPEKQLIMSAHSELFKATEKNMCLEPAIKLSLSHDNSDWGEREVSGEIILFPYKGSDSFSHGKYNFSKLTVQV